jgi:alpha-tubulin suppressor-like RCC1 family protein
MAPAEAERDAGVIDVRVTVGGEREAGQGEATAAEMMEAEAMPGEEIAAAENIQALKAEAEKLQAAAEKAAVAAAEKVEAAKLAEAKKVAARQEKAARAAEKARLAEAKRLVEEARAKKARAEEEERKAIDRSARAERFVQLAIEDSIRAAEEASRASAETVRAAEAETEAAAAYQKLLAAITFERQGAGTPATLLDLPLEMLAGVCQQQLDLVIFVRLAETCKRLRHGDGGVDTEELPTKSPVATALRALAFPRGGRAQSTRPVGCSESWVSYLARCVRQRRCQEASPFAAAREHSLFLNAAGRLLACGYGAAVGHGDANTIYPIPIPVAAMAGVWVRSVAASFSHSLALGWDGRVYSWGPNGCGQLGHGDKLTRSSPLLVEGLQGVCSIAAGTLRSLAVTQSGSVFIWGGAVLPGEEKALRPSIVEGFGEVRVRRVCAGRGVTFAIGDDGELFSWGFVNVFGNLGHGDTHAQSSPKRVEALRGIQVSTVSVAIMHALALAEDGLVYMWGHFYDSLVLGNFHGVSELLPKPVEALGGVRVSSAAAADLHRSSAVADAGELWAWGRDADRRGCPPLGHGEESDCPLPKRIESLRGIKVDAVAAGDDHALAVADVGSVYAWGGEFTAKWNALGLDPAVSDVGVRVPTPQPVPAVRVACGL